MVVTFPFFLELVASTTISTTSTPITQNSNFNNTTLFFFDIPPQMISFMLSSITNNPNDTPNSPPNTLFFPKQEVLSFDVN
ncbi:hypothetical protein C1646_160838 [Rhizophagus diaphanus]|nr:hypothetical protein C1646_160838 [Rhizophagus diaphanus] [Rhizophagus sp. MUCL 43196]